MYIHYTVMGLNWYVVPIVCPMRTVAPEYLSSYNVDLAELIY